MEYTIASGANEEELIRNVSDLLEAGWETEGGVTISPQGKFYQAMVRFEMDEDEYESGQEL